MNNYYFIINPKEHVLITADDADTAKEVFNQYSLYQKYQFMDVQAPVRSVLMEVIKQRQ